VRTSGQTSLCHAAFAAVGASSFSHFAHGAGIPWLPALLLAGLVAVPVGALVAIPAIRLSGLYLALATFGFGVLLQQLVYRTRFMFGRSGPLSVPRPSAADGDIAFYYVVLVVAVLACALVAALSGSVDVAPFDPFQSLLYLAVLAVAGRGQLRAAVVAAVLLAVLPAYLADGGVLAVYLPIAFGIGAIGVALAEGSRDEITALVARGAARGRARRARGPVAARLPVSAP
jgi:ABC-type branched-subunit amino acid transport system permease subunit